MNNKPPISTRPEVGLPDAMSADEVAGYMKYSVRHLYKLCREKRIPCTQPSGPGGRYHFSRSALRAHFTYIDWDSPCV